LLTGHTGFKGAWASIWLARLGARVTGLALPPETEPSLWSLVGSGLLEDEIHGDIRDPGIVAEAVERSDPQIVIHMAAQSLVRRSYAQPVGTFATNLMGTVHVLEAARGRQALETALIITTDKVYANNDEGRDFVEDDALGGDDPYSASKACAELATASYAASFYAAGGARLATARAGNVIGGGDWSEDRLIPDVWRAAARGDAIELRHPDATRPWQHVLEPLSGYLAYIEALARAQDLPQALNFGPPAGASATVASVAEAMASAIGSPTAWRVAEGPTPPEMKLLSIDPSRAIASLGWRPRLSCEQAVAWTGSWYARWGAGADPLQLCQAQIDDYEALP